LSSKTGLIVMSSTVVVLGLIPALAGLGTATAAPPGFPDLNAFQPVDPAHYAMGGRGGGQTFFATPDGIQCGWPLTDKPDDHVSAGCAGPIPGLPDNAPVGADGCSAVGTSTSLPSDLGPYGFHKGTGCPVITSQMLNVGQKISASNITCVVGADRLTACIDLILNRGFVLQPSGSWTF
jgi:hypothetical protein